MEQWEPSEGAAKHTQRRKKKSRLGRLPSEIDAAELASWFHVPAEEAAKAMRVSLTVLKRIARKNGITRWPYRKVKSLSRAIAQPVAGGAKGGGHQSVLADVLSPTNPLDQQIAAAAVAAAAASQGGSPKALPIGRSGSHTQLPQAGSGGVPGCSAPLQLPPVPLPGLADLPPLPLNWMQPFPQQQQQQQQQQPAQQRPVQIDAFHPAWQPPEPAAAPSGHSQGSRLWGGPPSPVAGTQQQMQQPQQAVPQRPVVVRPQPQAWPAWPVAPPAAAPMPAPADSAALTPTSADTRGIEVLLSAIEHEQQCEGAVQGPARAAPTGGAPSEEVAQLGGGSRVLARVPSDGSAGSCTNRTLPPGQAQPEQPVPVPAAAAPAANAGELLNRLGASLRAAAALAEHARQTPSPHPGAAPPAVGVRPVSIGGSHAFRPVQPQQVQKQAQLEQQARAASPGPVWQAAAAAAAAHHAQQQAQQQAQLPSPFEGASPRAVSPGSSQPGKGPFGVELSLQDLAARRASGTIPVAEKEGAALGEHGSGGDSNGGMQRLPTLEWPARQGARGSSPAPPAPSVHTAAATLGRQFSFGLPLASLNVPAGAALADNLAGSGSAELFGPSVPMRIADAVGAKRPAPAAGWQAGVAAGAGDGGSPSKRARPEAVPAPAPAHDPMAAPPTPRTASLQSMLGVLRQAAGMQPVEEQQREVDRHQLLRLLVASVGGGGGAGPTAQPPTPPPTNQAAGGLEALLRAGPWAQQAQQAPAQAPALPMQQLSQLLGGGEGSGSQALAQLALIKQLHQIQQAQQAQQQMQQAQQVQQAQQQMQQAQQAQQQAHQAQQQMQQMQQTQQAQAMAFQGFQAAPQQAVQAPQQAQQVAPQQAAAGQSVPEPVAMLYLQRIAKKLGYNIDTIALNHQALNHQAQQQQGGQQL